MKKRINLLALLLVWLVATFQVFADDTFCENGFTYKIMKDTSMKRYQGALSVKNYQAVPEVDYSQPFHIPASVVHEGKTYSVKLIGKEAFKGITEVQSIVIDEGIEHIGENAFECCTNLKSIHFPASADYIGSCLFGSCYNLTSVTVDANNEDYDSRDHCNAIIDSDDDRLVAACSSTKIPPSVTSIGKFAFYHCNTMEELIIPEGVEEIGRFAFYDCSQLKRVTLPQSLRKIDVAAFGRCNSLEAIYIPKNVCDIDERNIFQECYNLSSIIVDDANVTYCSWPNSNTIVRKADSTLIAACKTTVISENVKRLGPECFFGTIKHSIRIPKSVIEISCTAFSKCAYIDTIIVDPENPVYMSPEKKNVVLTKDGKTLVLGGCSTNIPDGIESIGDYAFAGRYSKTMLKIPEGVTSIEDGAFKDCNYISDVIIPSSVRWIGRDAFENCYFLKSVQMSSSVESISPYTFSNCCRLSVISIPEGVKEISN